MQTLLLCYATDAGYMCAHSQSQSVMASSWLADQQISDPANKVGAVDGLNSRVSKPLIAEYTSATFNSVCEWSLSPPWAAGCVPELQPALNALSSKLE